MVFLVNQVLAEEHICFLALSYISDGLKDRLDLASTFWEHVVFLGR